MSKYTTGEIAKLCGVTVRTVQYYDTRNILVPSELSEGGRRLYSDDDLKRMRIICFLREAGLPINSIEALMNEEHPENIISVLLDQQESTLREEMSETQKKLDILMNIKRELKDVKNFSVESIGDIAHIMKNKKSLSKLRRFVFTVGIIIDIIEVCTAVFWWRTGVWQPFAVGMLIVIGLGIWASAIYFKGIDYICAECHVIFKPAFKEAFRAYHTSKMRRLTCPVCGHKGLCVEVYAEKGGKRDD